MTTWILEARAVSVSTGDDALTIGFADEASGPGQYLLLQNSIRFSEQDQTLRQNAYYVEMSGQDTSFYGGITSSLLSSDRLELDIAPDNKHTQLEKVIVLRGVDASVWRSLVAGLCSLFEGTGVKLTIQLIER